MKPGCSSWRLPLAPQRPKYLGAPLTWCLGPSPQASGPRLGRATALCLFGASFRCLQRADRQAALAPLSCTVAAGMLFLSALGQLLDQGLLCKLRLCFAMGLMALEGASG